MPYQNDPLVALAILAVLLIAWALNLLFGAIEDHFLDR